MDGGVELGPLVSEEDTPRLLCYIERAQLGYDLTVSSAYGHKQVVYADYTASGKPLQFIEEYITREVLPCYGNTHTTTSYTSRQSTHFREEARCLLKESVHCGEDDVLIFVGSGCTGAVHKLVHCLSLEQLQEPPVVFVGPFEHHSNILPWKEQSGAEVIRIRENKYGEMDSEELEEKLQDYSRTGRQLIGAFSAASNITGVLTDTDTISVLLHRYGALAFWDYAAAAPYVPIDMNPPDRELAYKDAVYFSMHKFVGGPGSPGVLVAKKDMFRNAVPQVPGGGTVEYVTQAKHCYHHQIEEREEGGTPSIVGAVRAGLAMQLKQAVGSEVILSLEEELCRHVFSQWQGLQELVIVGPHHLPRLPVFSFLVRHPPSGLFLHHNFVSALLNDLFGIQARGGCSCAGPYGQALLDIPEDQAMEVVMDSCGPTQDCERELTKPGMTRVSFPYFMNQEVVDYIIRAVIMVAKDGWKLLSQYELDAMSGSFKHRNADYFECKKSLRTITYAPGTMTYESETNTCDHLETPSLEDVLEEAQLTMDEAFLDLEEPGACVLSERVERVRWFLTPREAWEYGHGRSDPVTYTSFTPKTYPARRHSSEGVGSNVETEQDTTESRRGADLTRNKSFRLHFAEVEGDESSDEDTPEVMAVSVSRVTASRSIMELDRIPAILLKSFYTSCDQLSKGRTKAKKNRVKRAVRKMFKSLLK